MLSAAQAPIPRQPEVSVKGTTPTNSPVLEIKLANSVAYFNIHQQPDSLTNQTSDLLLTTNLSSNGGGLNLTNWRWVLRTNAQFYSLDIQTNRREAYFILAFTNDTDSDGISDGLEHLVFHTDSNIANPPAILIQPQSQVVGAGSTAFFYVTAEGAPPVQYQWQRKGTNILNATNSSIRITSAFSPDAGTYSVWISNTFGATLSAPATLQITNSPGFWYTAPSPIQGVGNGSLENPWDLQTALNQTNKIGPGNTLWLLPGTYCYDATNGGTWEFNFTNGTGLLEPMPTMFTCSLRGVASNLVTVRAIPGARATIKGSLLVESGGFVRFQDLEVCNLFTTNRYTTDNTPYPQDWWTKMNGTINELCVSGISFYKDSLEIPIPGCEFINCVVHDNIGGGFGVGTPGSGALIYGCLSYYNGWRGYATNPATLSNVPRNRGHGFYVEHEGTNRTTVRQCMSFYNFAQGAQFYGNFDGASDCTTVDGTIIWQNSHFQPAQQRNFTFGNSFAGPFGKLPATDAIVTGCMVYDSRASDDYIGANSDSDLGYENGFTNSVISSNYFGSPVAILGPIWNTVIEQNQFMEGVSGAINRNNTNLYPSNTYYWLNGTPRPTNGLEIRVFANQYESGRGQIVIFNWGQSNSVTVDISSLGLYPGDRYELHNANNFYNEVVTNIYTNAFITIPMQASAHSNAIPVAYDPQNPNPDAVVPAAENTFPIFGAFIVKKSSVQ